jgi:hypothetical protein
MDFFRPICSPNMEVDTLPKKHPTSYIATINPVMVGLGLSNVFVNAGELTRLCEKSVSGVYAWGQLGYLTLPLDHCHSQSRGSQGMSEK